MGRQGLRLVPPAISQDLFSREAVFFPRPAEDRRSLVRHSLRIAPESFRIPAAYQGQLCGRRIVAIFHSRGLWGLPRPDQPPVQLHFSQDLPQLLQGDSPGAQDAGGRDCQIQDGGFQSHPAGASVQDRLHLSLQIMEAMESCGGAGLAGKVRGRRSNGNPRQPDHLQGCRMIRAADRHGIQPRRDPVRDIRPTCLPAPEHQGQRSGPEPFCQDIGAFRHRFAPFAQCLRPGHMDDQGVILRPALDFEDPFDRLFLQGARPQAVYGLRGQGHQTAGAQDGRGLLRLRRSQKQRLHSPSPRSFSACSALRRASMSSSRSPFMIASILYRVRPMR